MREKNAHTEKKQAIGTYVCLFAWNKKSTADSDNIFFCLDIQLGN